MTMACCANLCHAGICRKLVWCMLGRMPGCHRTACAMQVLSDPVPVPEEGVLSPELQDFVLQCMRKDPFRRPTAEGLLSHTFILKVRPISTA